MENQQKTQQEIEQEMLELNNQFSEFLHTKGIAAKFKLAFSNMAQSAAKQKEIDKANFAAQKAKSAEENKEFVEFLHTKGIKAKFNLVINNIKEGAKTANQRTAEQIAKSKAQAYGNYSGNAQTISAQTLTDEFNAYLKEKGLDGKYTVMIEEN
jgi:hypothetical protein